MAEFSLTGIASRPSLEILEDMFAVRLTRYQQLGRVNTNHEDRQQPGRS